MASNVPYVQKPHPLIAARIEYTLAPAPPLPSITPRIEFTAERLAYSQDVAGGSSATMVGHNDDNSLNHRPASDSSGDDSADDSAQPARLNRRRSSRNLKIPKPTGEPGRPRSGGFCVEDSLVKTHGWSEDSVRKLTVCSTTLFSDSNSTDNTYEQETVRVEARKQLNTTISYRGQSKRAIQQICAKVCQFRTHILRILSYADLPTR